MTATIHFTIGDKGLGLLSRNTRALLESVPTKPDARTNRYLLSLEGAQLLRGHLEADLNGVSASDGCDRFDALALSRPLLNLQANLAEAEADQAVDPEAERLDRAAEHVRLIDALDRLENQAGWVLAQLKRGGNDAEAIRALERALDASREVAR